MSNKDKNIKNPMDNVRTTDFNQERLETLKKLYPDLFANEGKVNLREIAKIMDYGGINEVERYEFRWFGKSNAKREAFTPTDATLVYDEVRSVNPTESENLIIEGENLAVLKLLSKSYREQVKCIYIDPPYNTGKDFVYSDNWKQDRAEYWEDAQMTENGYKIDTNVETDGRFHSNWLNMMYSRLLIARQLLREDGVIFISIDDNEVHHLRKLCDEVFGEDNFMANIVWQKKYAATNDAKGFSPMHDHIIVYRKAETFERNLLPRTTEQNKPYKNDDGDGKGLWRSDNLLVKSFSESGVFPIKNPNTGKDYMPAQGKCWRGSKSTIEKWLNEKRIFFGKDGKGAPQLKRYLKEVQQGRVPTTWWSFQEAGHNDAANKEMQSIFNSKSPFDTPKPTKLLKQIFKIGSNNNDIILDFFAGSGTTGQAITELNQEDGGNRKYILVQLPETTDEKSEAYKAGYKKISDITIERNKRVINKIVESQKKSRSHKSKKTDDLFSTNDSLTNNTNDLRLKSLGFKVFKLQKSNFPRVEFAPDPEKTEAENIELLKKYINDKEAQLTSLFNKDELITEILIKNGFKLNYTVTKQEQFKKNDIFFATDGNKETLICLDGAIANETVAYFKTNTEQKLIVLERALDTTKKWNLKHYMGNKFNAF